MQGSKKVEACLMVTEGIGRRRCGLSGHSEIRMFCNDGAVSFPPLLLSVRSVIRGRKIFADKGRE